MTYLLRLLKDRRGATAIEYGLIVTLIAIAALGVITTLGTNVNNMYTSVSNKLG